MELLSTTRRRGLRSSSSTAQIYNNTFYNTSSTLAFVENVIATRRSELRSPWRALTCFDQAVLTLVWLRDGDTFAQLGPHCGISTDTAWRYAPEAVAARRIVLDGTLPARDLHPPERRSVIPSPGRSLAVRAFLAKVARKDGGPGAR